MNELAVFGTILMVATGRDDFVRQCGDISLQSQLSEEFKKTGSAELVDGSTVFFLSDGQCMCEFKVSNVRAEPLPILHCYLDSSRSRGKQ